MEPKYTPGMLRVCIDRNSNDEFSGRVYGTAFKETLLFKDANEFILKIDNELNKIGLPQAFEEKRSFGQAEAYSHFSPMVEVVRKQKDFINEYGEVSTFVICIETRANTSWQGTLLSEELKPLATFNSELELLKLFSEN